MNAGTIRRPEAGALHAATAYTFTHMWKTNKTTNNNDATIYAAAGPSAPFPDTEITLQPFGCLRLNLRRAFDASPWIRIGESPT